MGYFDGDALGLLERIELRQSDDDCKMDLEVTCVDCGKHLCDAEPGDTLGLLARTVAGHTCLREA